MQDLVQLKALGEVEEERRRQDSMWGTERSIPSGTSQGAWGLTAELLQRACDNAFANKEGTWVHILQEEVYEVLAEEDPTKLQEELIQVAAVCVAWWEQLEKERIKED